MKLDGNNKKRRTILFLQVQTITMINEFLIIIKRAKKAWLPFQLFIITSNNNCIEREKRFYRSIEL